MPESAAPDLAFTIEVILQAALTKVTLVVAPNLEERAQMIAGSQHFTHPEMPDRKITNPLFGIEIVVDVSFPDDHWECVTLDPI